MPRYTYRCIECCEQSVVSHLSDETVSECPKCTSPNVIKLLNTFTTPIKRETKQKVGAVTEEFIQHARKELKQQKHKLDKDR